MVTGEDERLGIVMTSTLAEFPTKCKHELWGFASVLVRADNFLRRRPSRIFVGVAKPINRIILRISFSNFVYYLFFCPPFTL